MTRFLFIAASLLMAAVSVPNSSSPDDRVKRAWESIQSMAGSWSGSATDGRKIRHRIEVIAAGSVVMEESWFEGHPGEKMLTMYHLDGDKLMLTHYCVAKNQPRMAATEISEDGKRVLFTFLDGTNIPTRDKGHMDKALYQFKDKDAFTSRWTWYASGKEQWMEEFTFARDKGETSPASLPKASAGCCPPVQGP